MDDATPIINLIQAIQSIAQDEAIMYCETTGYRKLNSHVAEVS